MMLQIGAMVLGRSLVAFDGLSAGEPSDDPQIQSCPT